MSVQPFIKRGVRSNATARRLIAATSTAQHVLDSTIEDTDRTKEVGGVHATNSFFCGTVFVLADEHFWLVRSRCDATRFYVVIRRNGEFQCSSSEERVAQMCIQKVQVYLAERKEAARQAASQWVRMPNGTQRIASQVDDACLNSLDEMSARYAQECERWEAMTLEERQAYLDGKVVAA